MKKIVLLCLGTLLLTAAAPVKEWVREIEVKAEKVKADEYHYSFRFLPDKTANYDTLTFELIYHQEFPWTDVRGKKSTKIHEPVSFSFRESNQQFVNDLDRHISFRVPMGLEALEKKYGEKTFNKDYPITINRIKITAVSQGATVWVYEVPGVGKHNVATLMARQRAEDEKKKNEKEDTSDLTGVPKWLK